MLPAITAGTPQCNKAAIFDRPDGYNPAFAMHWN